MARVTPRVIGYAVADITSGNSITFNKSDLPSLVDGDMLVGVIRGSTSASTSLATCTGFTLQAPETYTVAAGGRLIGALTKPVTTAASEPSTYAFAYTGTSGRMTGMLLVVRDVDLTAAIAHGAPGNSPNYYSTTTFTVNNIGDLILSFAGNETVTPNASSPTMDSDYVAVGDHPSTTGTGSTRSCVSVGSRTADTTTAPSPAGTVWGASSGLAYWSIALQGKTVSTGLIVKTGIGTARLTVLVGGTRHTPVQAKIYLPGFTTVTAALGVYGATMGHRGASAVANMPEMSERSYDYSVLRGYGILEFSANRTSDGVWVGCHDPSVNRTSQTTGVADISSQTYATVMTFQNTLNAGSFPRPYYKLTDFLDKYAPHHVCWVDPKSAVGQVTEFLDLCDAHGGPTKIVVKYTGNSSGGAALSDAAIARGYQTWGYFYETDGQSAVDTYKGRYTILGMNFDASATAWGWVTGLGKHVVGHVCASQAAYNTALSMGADIVQCSRADLIKPVSAWTTSPHVWPSISLYPSTTLYPA